jgi:hypothetical protein
MTGDIRAQLDNLQEQMIILHELIKTVKEIEDNHFAISKEMIKNALGAHEALAAVVRDLLLENRALKNVLLNVLYKNTDDTGCTKYVNRWPEFVAEKKRLTEERT